MFGCNEREGFRLGILERFEGGEGGGLSSGVERDGMLCYAQLCSAMLCAVDGEAQGGKRTAR